jgi:hypothetical protein
VRALDGAGVHGLWGLLVFYLVPGLLILPVLALRWRQNWQGGRWLVLLGLATSVPLVCYSIAVLYTDVIRAMLLFYLTPIWSTIPAGCFLRSGSRRAPCRDRHGNALFWRSSASMSVALAGKCRRLGRPYRRFQLGGGLGVTRFDRSTHALESDRAEFLLVVIAGQLPPVPSEPGRPLRRTWSRHNSGGWCRR